MLLAGGFEISLREINADGWYRSTTAQREELEREVRAVMAAWLDRHDLRPKFWNADEIEEHLPQGDE